MAPVILSLQQLSITTSICNRSDQHLTASSSLFSGEKTNLLPRSTLEVACVGTSQYNESIELLDSKSNLICNIPIKGPSSSSKWNSIITSYNKLRILFRSLSPSAYQILVYTKRDSATFLSTLDDSLCLTSLCLPGTHDSLSLYGWPISSCQSLDSSVTKQLSDGIRYLDIRLSPKGLFGKERLLAYHGITDQRIEFGKVLEECFDFLNGVGQKGEFTKTW